MRRYTDGGKLYSFGHFVVVVSLTVRFVQKNIDKL